MPVPDILAAGVVFTDVCFSDLDSTPHPGRETWAQGFILSPGGVATKVMAAARMGAKVGLKSTISTDPFGQFCWEILAGEGINLDFVDRTTQSQPITVSIAQDSDRAMITYDPSVQITGPFPPSASIIIAEAEEDPWWVHTRHDHLLLDTHWDSTQTWDLARIETNLRQASCFTPNLDEALAYTRTTTPEEAINVLLTLVPEVVITLGKHGAIAGDNTGNIFRVDAIHAESRDTLGAGDVFSGAFAAGMVAGLDLRQRTLLAVVASGLSVQARGAGLSAPSLNDLRVWCDELPPDQRHQYSFISQLSNRRL